MSSKLLYVIKQETSKEIWTSSETFEANDLREVEQNIRAGWLMGEARWAEGTDGSFIFGLSANGVPVAGAEFSGRI